MTKNDFIDLLQGYKEKALAELNQELRAAAVAAIPADLKEQCDKATKLGREQCEEAEKLGAICRIWAKNNRVYLYWPDERPYDYYARIVGSVVEMLKASGEGYQKKEREITRKFDSAITTIKRSQSQKRIREIATMLGIEVEIEPAEATPAGLDVAFLKDKINALKAIEE